MGVQPTKEESRMVYTYPVSVSPRCPNPGAALAEVGPDEIASRGPLAFP